MHIYMHMYMHIYIYIHVYIYLRVNRCFRQKWKRIDRTWQEMERHMGNYKGPMCLRQTGRQRDREREIKKDVVPPWLGNVVTWNKTDRQRNWQAEREQIGRGDGERESTEILTDRWFQLTRLPLTSRKNGIKTEENTFRQTDTPVCPSVCLYVHLYVCLPVSLAGRLSVCLQTN